MNDKTKLAEKLYDAVGGIDDRLIQEADAPFRRKRSRTVLKVILIAAAVQILIVAMLVGTVVAAMSVGLGNTNLPDGNNDGSHVGDEDTGVPGVISAASVAKDDIDLFSGDYSVIIQYDDLEECTVIKVTESKMNSLMYLYRTEESARPDSSYDGVKIWLCDRNGAVVSPHLKVSDGNVGYGELFDYSVEISLSHELTQAIDRMTGRD